MTRRGTNGVRILCMSLALLLGAQGCSASCGNPFSPSCKTIFTLIKERKENPPPPPPPVPVGKQLAETFLVPLVWYTWPIWLPPIIVVAVLSKPHHTPAHPVPLSDHLRTLFEPAISPMQVTEPVLSEEATAEAEKPRP